MITLYNPATGTTFSTNGESGVSPQLLEMNILIELRVANMIALDAQRGMVTQTLEEYRSDAVNDSVNPVV